MKALQYFVTLGSKVRRKHRKIQVDVTLDYSRILCFVGRASRFSSYKQLDEQLFFRIYLFQFYTRFEHLCAHHQENPT
jgi:hypothetical protein